MIDIFRLENAKLKKQLTSLRITIVKADPSVMVDGRFEKMIAAPITVIEVAAALLESSLYPPQDQQD